MKELSQMLPDKVHIYILGLIQPYFKFMLSFIAFSIEIHIQIFHETSL